MTEATPEKHTVARRLCALLDHLGLPAVHLVGCMPADWQEFAAHHAERVATLSLILPTGADQAVLAGLGARVLAVVGERGAMAERVRRTLSALPQARIHTLAGYEAQLWSDALAERGADITDAMAALMGAAAPALSPVDLEPGKGRHAGLDYRVRGAGSPLLLLPVGLAPSQWEPVLDALAERHCVITVGGPLIGMAASLHQRLESGYGDVVRDTLTAARIAPGDSILEVGCGPGAIVRWLAREGARGNPIVGLDVNRYLLDEADAIARAERFSENVSFRHGDGEALPFPDASFDVVVACTVLEEVQADRLLAEAVRVLRPGGRAAIVVRAMDAPWWVNAPLDAAIRSPAEWRMGSGVTEGGCADGSLYARMQAAGLQDLLIRPQVGRYLSGEHFRGRIQRFLGLVDQKHAAAARAAVEVAEKDGSLFVAEPFHCAVGTRA